jgi:hypothetical protein
MWPSEWRKLNKVYKVFNIYDEEALDNIIAGKVFLRKAPTKRKKEE